MKKLSSVCGFVIAVALSRLALAAPSSDSLHSEDLVAICGDSITEQRQYSVYLEDYFLMCQPALKLNVTQYGWGGETATAFLARARNDVISFKPTVATTCYGMNDGGYAASTPARLQKYRESLTGIAKALKEGGVRFIVLGSPGVVDTETYKKMGDPVVYNQTLADLSGIAKEVAAEQNTGFADVHSIMMDAMIKAKAKYGASYPLSNDGVHPNPNGHLVMAYAFLKALGCDGNIGTITVDLKNQKAEATAGHRINSISNGAVEVESTRYPFCFSGNETNLADSRSMVEFIPFNRDLNRYLLVVKNAPTERLKVTWGKQSKVFAAADLAKGINLSAEFLDNPFCAPFQAAHYINREKQVFETTAVKVLLHSIPEWKKAVPDESEFLDRCSQKLISKCSLMRAKSKAAVAPVKHVITIEPAS